MIDAGADTIGDPTQAHMRRHRRARAAVRRRHLHPHRLRLARRGGQPRRRSASTTRARTSGPSAMRSGAGWSRSSRGRSRYSIIDRKAVGPLHAAGVSRHAGRHAARAGARSSACDEAPSCRRSTTTTPPAASARFDHTALDDCHTEGLAPAKTHWARPIDTPPFYGYPLRPGITFTYLGLKVDETRRRALRRPRRAPTCSWPAR